VNLFYACVLSALLLSGPLVMAQTNWVFGYNAHVKFGSRPGEEQVFRIPAQPFFGSGIDDAQGNLAFYQDGTSLYNGRHQVLMTGLKSFNEGPIMVVRDPAHPNYITCITSVRGNLRATVPPRLGNEYYLTLLEVDFATQSLVRVVKLNERIPETYGENCAVTISADATHHVLILHNFLGGKLVCIPIGKDYGYTDRIESDAFAGTGNPSQSPLDPGQSLVCIGVSPDRKWVALHHFFEKRVEVYSLDINTLRCTPFCKLGPIEGTHTLCFSPNSKRLYVLRAIQQELIQHESELTQYTIDETSTMATQFSRQIVLRTPRASPSIPNSIVLDGMQLDIHNRLCISKINDTSVAGILNPDERAALCIYDPEMIRLADRSSCRSGFPIFPMTSAFRARLHVETDTICEGNMVRVRVLQNLDVDTVTISTPSATHIFKPAKDTLITVGMLPTGTYPVRVTYRRNNSALVDTLITEAVVHPRLPHLETDSVALCSGSGIVLDGGPAARWQWTTGDTSRLLTVDKPGLYVLVRSTDAGCVTTDSVYVMTHVADTIDVSADTSVCSGTDVEIHAVAQHTTSRVTWTLPDGSSDSGTSITIQARNTTLLQRTDTLAVSILTAAGCRSDTFMLLTVRPVPSLTVDDTLIVGCQGDVIQLYVAASDPVLWEPVAFFDNPTSASPRLVLDTVMPTTLTVTTTNSYGCTAQRTIRTVVSARPELAVVVSAMDCTSGLVHIQASGADAYQWIQDGTLLAETSELNVLPIDGLMLIGYSASRSCMDTLVIDLPAATRAVIDLTAPSVRSAPGVRTSVPILATRTDAGTGLVYVPDVTISFLRHLFVVDDVVGADILDRRIVGDSSFLTLRATPPGLRAVNGTATISLRGTVYLTSDTTTRLHLNVPTNSNPCLLLTLTDGTLELEGCGIGMRGTTFVNALVWTVTQGGILVENSSPLQRHIRVHDIMGRCIFDGQAITGTLRIPADADGIYAIVVDGTLRLVYVGR